MIHMPGDLGSCYIEIAKLNKKIQDLKPVFLLQDRVECLERDLIALRKRFAIKAWESQLKELQQKRKANV